MSASWWILAAGATLGVLRAVRVIYEARSFISGGAAPMVFVEAAYSLVLHAAGATLLAAPVRAIGVWLDLQSVGRAEDGAGHVHQAPIEAPVHPATPPRPSDALIEARRLLLDGDWEGANRHLRVFDVEEGDRRFAAVRDEIGRARDSASQKWRSHVDAAREANDPNRVLELHAEAPKLLDDDARLDLDRDLAKWILNLVHRRLRSGVLQLDVVTLVDRASEALGHTKEGASLRAALPTLRRGAGLCARCAEPYRGFAEACPECLGAPEPPPPFIPGLSPVDEIEEPEPTEGEREPDWFLDPDEDANANGRYPH